jgi:hypothetical protein
MMNNGKFLKEQYYKSMKKDGVVLGPAAYQEKRRVK